ncbi:hypothetical protein GCM10010399_03510 [Dactylosporangium fulvum]
MSRSAVWTAAAPSVPGSRTTNSSPPIRQTRSCPRVAAARRCRSVRPIRPAWIAPSGTIHANAQARPVINSANQPTTWLRRMLAIARSHVSGSVACRAARISYGSSAARGVACANVRSPSAPWPARRSDPDEPPTVWLSALMTGT